MLAHPGERQHVDVYGFLLGEAALRDYDVSADGDRFLMMKLGSGSDAASGSFRVVVIQNWVEDLERLVPTD